MSSHASSTTPPDGRPVTIRDLRATKDRGERFAMVAAYDASSAAIAEAAGIPAILVGDSLGMVVLGYDSTLPVTLEEMLHHTRAVVRGTSRALVLGDLPFGSYQDGPSQALHSAVRMLKEGGAHGVKLEGGAPVVESVARLVDAGIPVQGHLGLTPQSVHAFGGYRVQAREADAADRVVDDAVSLQQAGAFSIVLEAVPSEVGRRVTEAVDIPVVGIGAGPHTDGQILVWHDMLGLTAGRLPRFVKPYATLRESITGALEAYREEVETGRYPAPEHTY